MVLRSWMQLPKNCKLAGNEHEEQMPLTPRPLITSILQCSYSSCWLNLIGSQRVRVFLIMVFVSQPLEGSKSRQCWEVDWKDKWKLWSRVAYHSFLFSNQSPTFRVVIHPAKRLIFLMSLASIYAYSRNAPSRHAASWDGSFALSPFFLKPVMHLTMCSYGPAGPWSELIVGSQG